MISEILVISGVPIIRNIAGWLEKSLEDGKFCKYEVKKLISTTIRLAVPGLALYFGFDASGEMAAAIPLVGDYLLTYAKKALKD